MKDRNELLLHHFATVSLMGLSYCWGFIFLIFLILFFHITFFLPLIWISRYYRIGAVIMVLHDFSDPFMEMAKVFLYIGHQSVFIIIINIIISLFCYLWMPRKKKEKIWLETITIKIERWYLICLVYSRIFGNSLCDISCLYSFKCLVLFSFSFLFFHFF